MPVPGSHQDPCPGATTTCQLPPRHVAAPTHDRRFGLFHRQDSCERTAINHSYQLKTSAPMAASHAVGTDEDRAVQPMA